MSVPPMPTRCQLDSAAAREPFIRTPFQDPFLTFSHAVYCLDIFLLDLHFVTLYYKPFYYKSATELTLVSVAVPYSSVPHM